MNSSPRDHHEDDSSASGSDAPASDLYAIEDTTPVAPPLPGVTVATASADELIDQVAADLVVHAENCVRRFGDFHLALSGATALQPLYDRLMYDPNYRRLPWRRSHLWLAAEARLEGDAAHSAFRQISETIVDHADIPHDQVHAMGTGSAAAAAAYEESLREGLAWREKGHDRLDYVLLVLEEDGAVAGLTAAFDGGHDPARLVADNAGAVVTLTLPFINAARFVAVVASGAASAEAVRRISDGGADAESMPAARLAPLNGELKWYVDGAAAGGS